MSKNRTLHDYRAGLDAPVREALDALRRIVSDAAPDMTEEIKWNAPSFAHRGRDRITLGVEPRGGYRIVLHRGARVQDTTTFRFNDSGRVAAWPAADRGVVRLRDAADIEARAPALSDLVARWIAATD